MSPWILVGSFVTIFIYFLISKDLFDAYKFERFRSREFWKPSPTNRYQAESSASPLSAKDIFDFCPFEAPDPWNPEIVQYIDAKYGFLHNCVINRKLRPITEMTNGGISIVRAEHRLKYQCRARCVDYVNEYSFSRQEWMNITNTTFDCDVVETECSTKKGSKLSRFLHTQISELKSTTGPSAVPLKRPSVHIILIDSVASTQAIRALPRTVNFLMNGMKAINFRKLNKVGANSRPNGYVMFFGKTTEAVSREMMQQPSLPADWTYSTYCKRYLDDKLYIPTEYRDEGYKTFGAQDYDKGLLNYPNCKGLKGKEFQHSYRTFDLLLGKDSQLKKVHQTASCTQSHKNMLDYLTKFLNAYKGSSKFSLSWITRLAHDNTRLLYQGDYDIYDFFVRSRRELDQSFVFFLGDHGPRFGRETKTTFGRSEANNPFLFLTFPQHLRESEIYNRTKEREFELITPHDLHATFKDILYHQHETSFSNYTYRNFLPDSRGSSLLRDFEKGVPRNCKILPISSQYCICQFKKVIVVNSTLEEQLGNFVMDRITEILKTNNVTEQCEPEVLKKVKALLSYDMPHDQLGVSAIYDITFETSPSGAVFQILIRSANGSLELAGSSFTRLNEYGSHGACMSKDTLKPLCYCKKKIIHSK